MFRLLMVSVFGVPHAMGVRRSESDRIAGASALTALFTGRSSSFSKIHLNSVLDVLSKSRGSDLTSELEGVVENLKTARGKVLTAVTTTSNEIEAKMTAWETATGTSVDDYNDAVAIDTTWSTCISSEKANASSLTNLVADRALALTARNNAETNATNLSPINEPLELDRFDCENSNSDCTANWETYENNAKDKIEELEIKVLAHIGKYEEANATWTGEIIKYNDVTADVRASQTHWMEGREKCGGLKTSRQSERCVYTRAQGAQCSAKDAVDDLLLKVNSQDNPFSYEDQQQETKSINLAICILETFITDETVVDDIDAHCTDVELTVSPDQQTSRYQTVKADATYDCDTTVFTFGGDQWTFPGFLPQSPDDEDVWGSHPNADEYVKTTQHTWSKNELDSECPDTTISIR